MLITKGDLLHQTSKLERSGLRDCFRYVEIVSHKTADVYARDPLADHGIVPDRFLMIGNSLRSDVLPVVEAGGWAVHVPAALSWSHEHADVPAHVQAPLRRVAGARAPPRGHRDAGAADGVVVAQSGTRSRTSPSRRAGAAAGRRRPGAGSRRS